MMDSYISDELLVETNHEVLSHLENCPACRGELAERRALRQRIRQTLKNAAENQLDPAFAVDLLDQLREAALRQAAWKKIWGPNGFLKIRVAAVGLAGLIVLSIGGFVIHDLQSRKANNAGTQTSQPGSTEIATPAEPDPARAVLASWNELTSKAIGDHKNCAVEFHLTEKPISLEEAGRKYGTFNKDLGKSVAAALKKVFKSNSADRIDVLEAHYCLFEGRHFAHIVLKEKDRLVSVLVTDAGQSAGNDEIQTARIDAVNTAGFRIGTHAVFVVSELSDADNISIAKAVAPAIILQNEKVGT